MIRVTEARMDVRDEADLFWRWNFADGQASGLQSSWPQDVVVAVNGCSSELSCGPVYVPWGGHAMHTYDCDLTGMPAYHRMLRIDCTLRVTPPVAVHVLHLALGVQPDAELCGISPAPVYGPRLCNLVPHTLTAQAEHDRSRTTKPMRSWLARVAAKAAGGHADRRLLHALTAAADVLLLRAADCYAQARRLVG